MAIFFGIVAFVLSLAGIAGAVLTFLETAYCASAMFMLVGALFLGLSFKFFTTR